MRSYLLPLILAMAGAGGYRNRYANRKEANAKRFAEINRKSFGEKPLSKFVIKGHEIEAYSRKDAIVRLKHRGLYDTRKILH